MTGEHHADAARRILSQPISHISYAVDDIETAVERWTTVTGAGPFFVIDPVRFDLVETGDGQPATWDHTAAFGQWGSICIELQQLHDARPSHLRELLTPGRSPVANHVAVFTDTPEEDSAALTAIGAPAFVHAQVGKVDLWLHDTRDLIGQALEIHRVSPELLGIFEEIAAAAQGWDGSRPLRPMP